MELTKYNDVINLLEKSSSYLHQQEKLFILINNKTYIIHNVNQNSYEYILRKSSLNPSTVARKYIRIKGEKWTPEEEEIVLQNPKLKTLEILLPNRTKDAIRHKLYNMMNPKKK